MAPKTLFLAAVSMGAIAVLAGCGGSSGSSTPTPSGGLTLPSLPGLGSGGSGGSAPGADTLLGASDVQSISGDPNVAVFSGVCSAVTCLYSDPSSSGDGGAVVVEPFPGGIGQAAIQAAVASALSSSGSGANGNDVTAVSGLGSGAIKEIDSDSATYAFVKDNYLVIINVTSSTKTGADMDSQVEAAAQTAAGKL